MMSERLSLYSIGSEPKRTFDSLRVSSNRLSSSQSLPSDDCSFGAKLGYTQTVTRTGGCLSCEQAEVFPNTYEIHGSNGEELYGLHQRRRVCGNWLMDFCPSWCFMCPLEETTEIRSVPSDADHVIPTKDVFVVQFEPKADKVCPCFHNICSSERTRLLYNEDLVGTIRKRNLLERACSICCIPFQNNMKMYRVDLILQTGEHVPRFFTKVFEDHMSGAFWRMFGCMCIGQGCCLTHPPTSFTFDIPVYDYGNELEIGTIQFSGKWQSSACFACHCCHRIKPKYEVNLNLPPNGYSLQESELLLGLAMHIDKHWVIPHLQHKCGPTTCSKLFLCLCDD
eukprot:m.44386 g.44386  ORF g.44386 m.44386 type:complete len:338 (+) comp7165_c0_seq1:89-1102(+)